MAVTAATVAATAAEAGIETRAADTNPIAPLSPDARAALLSRMEAALDDAVRPGLRADGVAIEVVGIDDDRIVQVRLTGSCQGCASATMTLTFGVETALRSLVPEVRFLEAVL